MGDKKERGSACVISECASDLPKEITYLPLEAQNAFRELLTVLGTEQQALISVLVPSANGEAADLPGWTALIAPSLVGNISLSDAEEFGTSDPFVQGKFVGFLYSFLKSAMENTVADLRKGEREKFEAWGSALFSTLNPIINDFLKRSWADAGGFFSGFAKGYECAVDDFGDLKSWTDATPVHSLLLLHRQEVQAMESMSQLHAFVVEKLGKSRAGDLERLKKICSRMGLKFRKRGRPRKKRDSPS